MGTIAVALCGACNAHPLKPVCLDHEAEETIQVSMDSQRKVDILFVIDDSGSMGEEQAALASNFEVLVERLEQIEVGADYRIGIITTNNPHPHCADTSDVELGALQLRSCLSHLDHFIYADIDRREEACRARCPAHLADLSTTPTALEPGGPLAARPWLQRDDEGSNVPDGVTTAQALACWGPQGISGCGYESPLEAMVTAFDRSQDDDDPMAGFLRDDALLQVVIITDEADCSATAAGFPAFDPDGDRALWPDPNAQLAPSAVCWNAGVACESRADGSTSCRPADLDAQGQPTAVGEAALHPLSRYLERLGQLDQRKRQRQGSDQAQVLLSVIAGVPIGYAGEAIDYGPGTDAEFAGYYGVGAGCSSDRGEAVPPVRLLAMAESMDETKSNVFSICDGDYRPALEAIANRLIAQLSHPTCIDSGGRGSEVVDAGEVEHCIVQQRVGNELRSVATCQQGPEGWELPPGASLCTYAVTDEELHETCTDESQGVELRYLQAPNTDFGSVEVTCEVGFGPSCAA
ncbi:MAG: vWA domain-containing protein [Myxococcota bacterium]